jgi:hypothetical protein
MRSSHCGRAKIRGTLPMALVACREGRAFVLPTASAFEAACIRAAVVDPASMLLAGHRQMADDRIRQKVTPDRRGPCERTLASPSHHLRQDSRLA